MASGPNRPPEDVIGDRQPGRGRAGGTATARSRPAELRSVGNALTLIGELVEHESIGVAQAARILAVAPSTAHRLLSTLVAHGFAMRSPELDGRYRRGPALVRGLRHEAVSPVRLQEIAHPILERIAARSGETAHLAVLDGLDAVGIDHVESQRTVVARHPNGTRMPPHATAVGQALLAFRPDVAEALIAEGLTHHTGETIEDPRALRRVLREVRRRGYAVNIRGWQAETAGVAAPVLDAAGRAVASVGISGPVSRVSRRDLVAFAPLAVAAAGEIGHRLALAAEGSSHQVATAAPGSPA